MVVPALLTLKAGESRNVRVGTTVQAGTVEQAYRIFIEQLPGAPTAAAGASVSMRTRLNIPVFIDPAKPEARIEVLAPQLQQGGHLAVEAKSVGNTHVFVTDLEFIMTNAAGATVFATKGPAFGYILPGHTRVLTSGTEKPTGDQCRASNKLTVRLTAHESVVEHSYPIDPAGCAK
jgi:P pilus assembly chaperone PapD